MDKVTDFGLDLHLVQPRWSVADNYINTLGAMYCYETEKLDCPTDFVFLTVGGACCFSVLLMYIINSTRNVYMIMKGLDP